MARDSVLIKRCRDSQLWYHDYIGCVFEVLEYDALTKMYWVSTFTGRNIIYEEDCDAWELVLTKQTQPEDTDPVERPSHYVAGEIECIDAIQAATTQEEFEGFLRGNVLKYLWRCNLKSNKTEDLNKARWYLNRLIEETEQ